LGQLAQAEYLEVQVHLADCETCWQLLETLPPDIPSGSPCEPSPAHAQQPIVAADENYPTDYPSGVTADSSANMAGLPRDLAEYPKYRILELLGRGGMGAVYKAEHRLMDRLVALKVINRNLTDKAAAVQRFHREIKAAARLAHPNIVASYDAEQAGDTHLLVMEYVAGRSLAHVLAERGRLDVGEASDYVWQALIGLEHAFQRGMVHRDIKPPNLMLTPEGQIKILDFGLALFASERGRATALTDFGSFMGTADYIAPEQARDAHTADIRADLYSMGATLYHLLAGHSPFPEGTFVQKLVAQLERTPRRLTEIRSDVPAELARIVERLMAKDRTDRFQTPAEAADALVPFVTGAVARRGVTEAPHSETDPAAYSPREHSELALGTGARNPFGATDVHEPDGDDVRAFAAQVTLLGGAADDNAPQWAEDPVEGTSDSFDAHWSSRWRGGTSRGKWVAGVATVKSVGDRVYILHTDATDTFLIDARREGGTRLVGRYINLGDPADSTPWVGLIVDPERIDGQWALGRWDLRRKLKDDRERLKLRGHKGQVLCLAFRPDGRILATGSSDQTAKLWDVSTGTEVRTFSGHSAAVRCVAFAPDGSILASGGGYDQLVKLWDVTTGAERQTLAGHDGLVYSVSFSPDGRLVASSSEDHTVKLWAAATGVEQCTLTHHAEPVRSVAFSPNGQLLASASNDHTVIIWDLATGTVRRVLNGHTDRVLCVCFSPDGRMLASGGNDHTVRLWDLASGAQRHKVAGHNGVVFAVAISPDGTLVASASVDHTAVLSALTRSNA
jgi:serine/threonine protein kinase